MRYSFAMDAESSETGDFVYKKVLVPNELWTLLEEVAKVMDATPKWCLGMLIAVILAAAFLYPKIILLALGASLGIRGLVAVALVAPLGLFMGMPFPSGIRRVSDYGGQAVPWMWAVNGGATVLGSVLAIVLAIWFSFTTVLIAAALGYLLAWLLSLRLFPRREGI